MSRAKAACLARDCLAISAAYIAVFQMRTKLTQRVDSRVERQQYNCNGLHWGLCPDLLDIPRLVRHYMNWLVLDNHMHD